MRSLNPHLKKIKKQVKWCAWEAETGELPGTQSPAEMSRNSTSAQWRESAPDSCPPCVHHGTSVLAHTKN